MLNREHGAGLDWSALFLHENENSTYKKQFLKDVEPITAQNYSAMSLKSAMISSSNTSEVEEEACIRVALKFCIMSNFAKEVLSPEDFEKSKELYKRKQFNSKLLKELISKFKYLLIRSQQSGNSEFIRGLFYISIEEAVEKVNTEKADKLYGPLKKSIERIASGVPSECYMESEKGFNRSFDKESNEYLISSQNYDFNSICGLCLSSYFMDNPISIVNHQMRMALLDDEKFFEEHKYFNVFKFIELVRTIQDSRHAEKILDEIFRVLRENPVAQKMISAKLPLYYVEEKRLIAGIEDRNFRFTFGRFENFPFYEKLKIPVCVPLTKTDDLEKKLQSGKETFVKFIENYVYPENHEEVMLFLKTRLTKEKEKSRYSVLDVLDYTLLWGEKETDDDRRAITLLASDYFSKEQILNRVYLKVYVMENAIPKELLYPCMFECFYNVTQVIEDELQIKTELQLDLKSREEAFQKLKKTLKKFGIIPTKQFQNDYIVSLLDRKVALLSEAERFPVLEQLGDAIYGLSVAELMFYQPDGDENNFAKDFETYNSAPFQVELSEKAGFDDLYISATSFPSKYLDDTVHEDRQSSITFNLRKGKDCDEKYLADSLEMVIGTVCLEHGIAVGMQFTKRLLKSNFPEIFKDEIRYTDENIQNKNIERDYFTRILPAPYSYFEDEFIQVLSRAFSKALLCVSLGTEDEKTRRYITNNGYGFAPILDVERPYNWVIPAFDCYLRLGIKKTVDAYKQEIAERYHAFNY